MSDATTLAGEVIPSGQPSLADIAAKIMSEHQSLKDSFIRGASAAVRIGELLLQARDIVPHGQFLAWITENTPYSDRTAQVFMKLARELPQFSNPQNSAHLTVSAALQLLDGLKLPAEKEFDPTKLPKLGKTPLQKLQDAWTKADKGERKQFLDSVGGD